MRRMRALKKHDARLQQIFFRSAKLGIAPRKAALVKFLFVLLGFAPAAAQTPQPLASSTQLLVVTTDGWNAVRGVLQRYERAQPGTKWRGIGDPIDVVVGKNGLGWGSGVIAIRVSALEPIKKEGDKKAPAGIFRLSTAFGYAGQSLEGWKMPYVSLSPSVECVDDAHSKFYNRVVDRAQVLADWNSSEKMLDSDDAYRWGIVIEDNTEPVVPGNGSCIFMHIWQGPGIGTAGCTAMPQQQLEAVLGWLDPAKRPLLVQLPLAKYRNLKKAWKLPRPPKPERQ